MIKYFFFKFMFTNGRKQKTSNFFALFRQTGLWEPNPPKNVHFFFANSESCQQCGYFWGNSY